MNISMDLGRVALPPISQSAQISPRDGSGISPSKNLNNSVLYDSPPKKIETKQAKRYLNSSMDSHIQYRVSVQDVINSTKKVVDDWGMPGYAVPKSQDKPIAYKMGKDKSRDFISELIKKKAYIPGPEYNIEGSMILKKKVSFTKLPRITEAQEIMKAAEKLPSPGQYDVSIKTKALGIFKQKSDRTGFLDEAIYQGSVTPSHYDSPRLESYKPRSSVLKIVPPTKERFPKFERTDQPSPTSYQVEQTFKKIKPRDLSYKIGNQKQLNFIDKYIKSKSFLPSVGQYEIQNKDKLLSRYGKSYK